MLKNLFIDWQQRSLLAIVLAIAIGISSCQQMISSSSAQTKNQLVSTILSDPKTFNPLLSRESPNIFGYVLESLIGENGKGELEPDLAESWQIALRLNLEFASLQIHNMRTDVARSQERREDLMLLKVNHLSESLRLSSAWRPPRVDGRVAREARHLRLRLR